MAILVRAILHINSNKWEELEQIRKERAILLKKHGWPQSRSYRMISGPDTTNMMAVEWEFESFAESETFNEKLSADPENKKIFEKYPDVIIDVRYEFYEVLSSD